jgi:hypothetical protein
MIGVSPAGLITFISNGLGGKASDKFQFNESHLIENIQETFGPTRFGIMVDKGYLIEEECFNANIDLFIPTKKCSSQFTKQVAVETKKIASARVHVERVIGRLRNYKILKDRIKPHMYAAMDDIIFVCCALVNLEFPVLADDKFY